MYFLKIICYLQSTASTENITNFYTFALMEQMASQPSTTFFKAQKQAGKKKDVCSLLDVLIIFPK